VVVSHRSHLRWCGIGNESMTGVLGVGFCELDLKDGWMDE